MFFVGLSHVLSIRCKLSCEYNGHWSIVRGYSVTKHKRTAVIFDLAHLSHTEQNLIIVFKLSKSTTNTSDSLQQNLIFNQFWDLNIIKIISTFLQERIQTSNIKSTWIHTNALQWKILYYSLKLIISIIWPLCKNISATYIPTALQKDRGGAQRCTRM